MAASSKDSEAAEMAATGSARGLATTSMKSILIKLKAARPLNLFRPKELKRDKLAKQLGNNPPGLGPRVASWSITTAGHCFGGAVLFGSYDVAKRLHAFHGLPDAYSDWAAGAVAGAAHALATSPLVGYQRSGRLDAFEGFRQPMVVVRDSASYACFFGVYSHLAPRERRGTLAAAAGGATAGGTAGIACHAVRFPLQTVYKRGKGWIDGADLRPSALARRFATTGARAGLSAAVAFGLLEVAIGVLDEDDVG